MPRVVDYSSFPSEFKKLDPRQIRSTSFCYVIGRRGTGKTQLIKDLCFNFYKNHCLNGDTIDLALVFSPTEPMQRVFEKFVPPAFIFPRYREDIILLLMETQQQLIEKNGHTATVLLIIDDCAYNKKFFVSEVFRQLAMNGRHCKICVLCAVQYSMDIPTSIRANIDITFAMQDNSMTNKKRYFSNFFSQFPDFKFFIKTFDRLTDNYKAIVSLNNNNSTNLQDTVYWYKADPSSIPDHFPLGRSIFWKMTAFSKLAPNLPAKGSIVLLDVQGNHVLDGEKNKSTTRPSSGKNYVENYKEEYSSEKHKSKQSSSLPSIIELS